ncbi:MAG TPA: hypothetical protein VK364_12815, partial [Hymenobacter sp.]|nr:hypothetical protein [Hymenobacter sp.]
MFTRKVFPLVTAVCLSVLISNGLTGCQSKSADSTESEKSTASADADGNAADTKSDASAAAPAPDPSSIPASKIADAA